MQGIKSLYRNHSAIRALVYPVVVIRRMLGINNGSKQALCDLHQKIIIDHMQSLLADDPVLNVKDFNGNFRMSPSSHLLARILREGSYEPEIARLVEKFAPTNQDVIDVGANVGFFTVKIAKHLKQGKVLAVEPTRNALIHLKDNIARNGVHEKVLIFEGVATNREGKENINFIEGNEEYSTLGVISHPSVSGEKTDTQQVNAATLDSLARNHGLKPGFLKVDVEGAEHLVFGGASEVLKNHRPVILAEICDPLLQKNGSSAAAIISLIQAASYDVYDAGNPERAPGNDPYGNVICFPKESKMSKQALKLALAAK